VNDLFTFQSRISLNQGTTRLDLRAHGKRPDGLTLTPYKEGRCATWDVTVTDTVAASYLSATSTCAGLAAEAAAKRKEDKYAEMSSNYHFFRLLLRILIP